MMPDVDFQAVTVAIIDAINDSPKKSRRVLLKTLIKMYGFKTRRKHWLEAIQNSLNEAGVVTSPSVADAGRDDWVILSTTDPRIPVDDFAATAESDKDGSTIECDPWISAISGKLFRSEREVEIRFVLPLLELLGYEEDDRSDGYPVEQVVGVRRTRTEADFVLFDGLNRGKDNALLVVEAKNVGKNIVDHIGQARSYAMFLGTPYFMVTNGDEIRVFLYRSPIESDVEVFKSHRKDLVTTFKSLYNIICKRAIVGYKRKRAALTAQNCT
jgi:hypothetical protein